MLADYKIKTEQFEGPLELLVELIEKEELDITKLSISKVADDFLEFVDNNQEIGLVNLSEFLLVASQLILLKSKALLPLFEFTKEEEEEIDDLEERLREYKKFKDISIQIGELYQGEKMSFSRKEARDIEYRKFIDPKINSRELADLYRGILSEKPEEDDLIEEVMQEVVSLEEKMTDLKTSLEKRMKIAFAETIKNASDKMEVVVTFLAMLEMVKQKTLSVKQKDLFGDILLTSRKNAKK